MICVFVLDTESSCGLCCLAHPV